MELARCEVRPFEIGCGGEPARVIRGRAVLPAREHGPAPWVLVLHGFKGFMDWGFFPELARRLAARGAAAVCFNASGSGIGPDLETFSDEQGFFRDTLTRHLEDVAGVDARVRAGLFEGLDPARAALFGHSRGGALAILHAARRRGFRAVATWAAVATFDRWDAETKERWRREGRLRIHNARTGQDLDLGLGALEDFERNRAALDVLAACRRLEVPLLAAHGSADESVDAGELDWIAAAVPARLLTRRLVEGAGHTFGATHPLREIPRALDLMLEETITFLASRLGLCPARS